MDRHLHYQLAVSEMGESNAIVAVYDMPEDVEAGILALRESGFDLQNVSVLGPGDASAGDPGAYYQMPGRIGCWGKMGTLLDWRVGASSSVGRSYLYRSLAPSW